MIVHIDLGTGNLGSLLRAFQHLGVQLAPAASGTCLETAGAIILPGVGSFGDGMASLRDQGLVEPLLRAAAAGVPIFGICLGMQLLAESSEEHGSHAGLGLIRGHVRRLPSGDPAFQVPNIGWCDVRPIRPGILFPEGRPGIFYHVHSYHLDGADPTDVTAVMDFGDAEITVAVERDNLFGVQFHPEKSQDDGLSVLASYLAHLRRLGRLT